MKITNQNKCIFMLGNLTKKILLTIVKQVQRLIIEHRKTFEDRLFETIEIWQAWLNQNAQVFVIVLVIQNTNLVYR